MQVKLRVNVEKSVNKMCGKIPNKYVDLLKFAFVKRDSSSPVRNARLCVIFSMKKKLLRSYISGCLSFIHKHSSRLTYS